MRLLLNELKHIIAEAAQMLLNEISIRDAYAIYYKDIPEDDYMTIVNSVQGNASEQLDPYTKWVLKLYKKKSPRLMEDLYKLRNEEGDGYLDIFKRAKERRMIGGQQADLNQYKSISELGQFVNSLDYNTVMGKTKGEISNAVNAAANNADFPYEDDVWKVVIPKSYEASCYWGNGTDWCTATRENDYYYNFYSKQGPLFVNINKNTGEKYQFHFESEQFMDSDDIDIDKPIFNAIGASSGLIEYYKKYLGGKYSLDFMRLQYEEYEQEENFIVFTNKDSEYFIIDTTYNEPVYDDWVLDYEFDDGAIRLKISFQGKTQYIVWSGYHNMIIPECMYDFIGEFDYDVAYVMQNNKYNYIDGCGELLSRDWFDDCEYYDGEYDKVVINGKENLFSRYNKELVMEMWVDSINVSRYDVLAEIKLDEKINLITDKGRIIFPEFVEAIEYDELYNGTDWYLAFKLNGKWNFQGTKYSGLLSKIWFDEITGVHHDRYNTLAWVKIDGVEYTLDLELETLKNDETGEEFDITTDENKNFYNNR